MSANALTGATGKSVWPKVIDDGKRNRKPLHLGLPVERRPVCELRKKQGRHQKVETHEAAGKNGCSAKGEYAFERPEENAELVSEGRKREPYRPTHCRGTPLLRSGS